METNISTYEESLLYKALGFSVRPIEERKKRDLFSWRDYTKVKPSNRKLRKWFYNTNKNIGIIGGDVSNGLFFLDFDNIEGFNKWNSKYNLDTPIQTSGSGGKHVALKTNKFMQNKRFYSGDNEHLGEIRGDSGYVVAYPSIHPNGNMYKWEKSPLDYEPIFIDDLRDIGLYYSEEFKVKTTPNIYTKDNKKFENDSNKVQYYLSRISNGEGDLDYYTWSNIGMVIYNCLGIDGEYIWKNFCLRHPDGYDEKAKIQWKSFTKYTPGEKGYGMGSLHFWAKVAINERDIFKG